MTSLFNWGIQTVTAVALGAIAYFLKEMKKVTEEKLKKNEEKLEELENKFNDFKETIPLHYTLKDDFIRAMSNVDRKLDKITDILSGLKKGCD